MSSAPIVDRIRIIPRPDDFLDRNVGSSGEVFFNRETSSLRVYSGKAVGGFEIARADLDNVSDAVFSARISNAGLSDLSSIYTADNTLDWAAGIYDFGNNILTYSNAVQLESELANYSPATYHGMTMHVHETGALYFAHAGEWRKLLTDTSHNDAVGAGYTDPLGAVAYSNEYGDLDNLPNAITSILDLNIVDGTATQILTTDGAGNFTFEDAPETGSTQNLFSTITSDDGSTTADAITDTLSILGGTNITTAIATDTNNVTIDMSAFSIDFLNDVDTTSTAPTTGQVLKWNGTNWAPGADATTGGAGTDADTLDGFDSSYFLNYNNFSNTPSVVALDSFSVGNELTASGDGAISYDDTSGVFRYTPPDLSSFLTSVAFSDLTTTPTTLAGYGITDAALSSSVPTVLTDLSISDGTNGQVLTTDGSGSFTFTTISGVGGEYSDTDVDAHLNTSSATTNEILSWTGSDYDWVAQSGEDNQNAFSIVAISGQPDAAATTVTDTLTLAAGTGVSLTTSGNTVTIANTVSAGASNFDELGDVITAGIRIDQIYEPAIAMLRVDNSGATAYTFPSHYSGNNPTIYAISGTTLAFDLSAIPGHPFELQDNTLTALTSNLVHVAPDGTVSTDSNAQGKDSGTLYWRIPENANNTFAYQCQFHAGMVGSITVKDIATL